MQIATTQALHAVENWLDSLDQPSIDGLNTYVVSGAVKNAGITVAGNGTLGLDDTDDRLATETMLARPFGLAFDAAGSVTLRKRPYG